MKITSINNEITNSLTIEEAIDAITLLVNCTRLDGIVVHEIRVVGSIAGFIHLGCDANYILIRKDLSIQQKAWVLAHEVGHACTVHQFTPEELESDLIFGNNYELIARVERAADEWAAAFLNPPWRNKEVKDFVACVA